MFAVCVKARREMTTSIEINVQNRASLCIAIVLTTMVMYDYLPVVTLIETDEKMSPSPVQALYAKLRILLLCMCDNTRFMQCGMYTISTTVETVLRIYGQALRRNISPGRVFRDIMHASKSTIDRNVNSVLSRK